MFKSPTKHVVLLLALIISGLASCRMPDVDRFDPVAERLTGKDVRSEVSVVRDRHGIVHIEAQSDADAFYAAGYAMAQDRFTQMDYFRKAGSGRLSELLGSPGKVRGFGLSNIDKALRLLRFEAAADEAEKNLDPESRELLGAFTSGVNAYLADSAGTIAIYEAWKIEPDPWTIKDCFVVAELMGVTMSMTSFFEEYYLERIRVEQGDTVRDLFVPSYPESGPVISNDELFLAGAPFLDRRVAAPGSNNWALSGKRTVSGLPLLANDPHVPMSIVPTFWWHCHLKSKNYDIMGLMFPGFPCFGAATNGKVAWALTNVMADYADLYREKVNPDDPGQYLLPDGSFEDFVVERGEVKIRGKRAEPYTMRRTRHGVVLEESYLGYKVKAAVKGEVLVLRFVDMDLPRFFRGYQIMARAENFEEWLAGARDEAWGPFAWNHAYADPAGNIAYWATGHFPVRPDNKGYVARRGWVAEEEWQGYVPFEQNPHLVNPRKGYIASANNRAELPDYPYYITVDYMSPGRASRISELIEGKEKHDVKDMQRIQYDVAVYEARHLVPVILADLEGTDNRRLILAAEILREWRDQGYVASADSRGTCVYEVFMAKFPAAVFEDEIGEKTSQGASMVGLFGAALGKIIDQPDSEWFDNVRTEKRRETRSDVVRRTMYESMRYLRRKLGNHPEKWQWGDLSTISMSPSFFPIPGWTEKYSLGPYPLPGTNTTVRAGDQLFIEQMGFVGFIGPSTHFIVDMTDPERALFNCSAGMAEYPLGDRYGNLTPDWFEANYQVMSMDGQDYRKEMMGELLIAP